MASNSFREISRRKFLRNVALGTSALAVSPILNYRSLAAPKSTGAARWEIPLNNDWLFGGKFSDDAVQTAFGDSAFEKISLPHSVAKLSWHNWKFSDWSDVWIYRKHFSTPENLQDRRVFLHFDAVTTSATPSLNGHALPAHVGGYLPFEYEITEWLAEKENLLAVAIDGRWQNVPPEGSPRGAGAVDFFEPGGMTRPVSLRVVPQIFISDVFAKPVNVLDAKNRRVEIAVVIDAGIVPTKSARVKIELFDANRKIADATQEFKIENVGETKLNLALTDLPDVKLWDVDSPQLYQIVATLILDETPVHDFQTRIGFREARFELDGFFLNGRRLQLFGLNRHELFPYVGFAASARAHRRDAEILRRDLNCNVVRCSHYPQSENFLAACDELGLLVWEEIPGWSYIGNAAWQDLLVRDVRDMIVRDRNRPSVIIWGVRVNESNDNPELYRRTTALAKSLDDSRPASGAMVGGGPERHSTKHWAEDVFAYNDYRHVAPDFDVSLEPPLPGVPYLITEAVGQIVGPPKVDHKYRRAGDPFLQARQAIYHAQVHDQALKDRHYAGVIAWCAFEYGSPMNSFNGIKCPGVMDFFRIPKLGASFYQSQIDPQIRPVIQPNFYWDLGIQTPRGPGKNAAIFSNCDRLKLFLDGKPIVELKPDRVKFPHLKYAPFFADLDLDGAGKPELRIDGFVGDKLVLSKSFSSDATQDQFFLRADDTEISGDGIDTTRLVFGVTDKFGAPRVFAGGEVSFQIEGTVKIVGDNPFQLTDAGGFAAVWVKARQDNSGKVQITAAHSILGTKSVEIFLAKVTSYW
ncbi:MAG TPA: glycoside hydrolase family 2 TIM barrel-domain containing protein [Verrucomicrobiae bacterium]|nr:glycoside hydrolase family 2 TIM barrel-domain containing protein [Verrucomicrobiae bacterium]